MMSGISRKSKFSFICFLGLMLLGGFIRISNFGEVMSQEGGIVFGGTDAYYQLRRLVYFLAHFPKTLVRDPLVDWPHGSLVNWPEAFTWLLGTPLKLFGVHNFQQLEWGVVILMLLIGLLSCYVIYRLAQAALQSETLSLYVLFLAAINFVLVRYSCAGQCDHHILEALFPPLVLWLAIEIFRSEKDKIDWKCIFLGLLIAFSLLSSSSGLFVVGMLTALLLFVYSDRNYFKRVFVIWLIPIGICLLYSFVSHELRGVWFSILYPSLFQASLLVLCAGLSLFIRLIDRGRGRLAIFSSLMGAALLYILRLVPVWNQVFN